MDHIPKLGKSNFKCPHCKVVSQQEWFDKCSATTVVEEIVNNTFLNYRSSIRDYHQEAITKFLQRFYQENKKQLPNFIPSQFSLSTCLNCLNITLWIENKLVYPKQVFIEPANQDMNDEIQNLYNEASAIVTESPKGATALLRLALQLLLKQLGKSGKNINNDIKDLVSNGLSPKIQQALDILRVVGNNAVHPGQIDLNDDNEIAIKLFHILNFIANEMITKPKELEFLYSSIIPEDTQQHIKDRDGT
ncbi:DUF4145 domain-containing protein [Acinetobacter ursingii]|uniref:DUF4145 domain-containing protein n=1 Tax=Acinetobacter ursingii TaxID=108980 RepID=A0AA46NE35_9GAMM|nr:DUF4145 domain-containing protein [Acinetobacter ursingii]UYF70642.1 DUF4145 domain-containing protein [Acinetobacter ursingii]